MAKIFLEAGSDVNYPVGDDSSVYGTSSATDSILIGNNVEGVVADQNVEKILLEGNSANYRYQQWGNTIKIYSADGSVLIGSAAIQADGTDLVFANGKVAVTLVDGVMKFGGTTVNEASPTVLTPGTIDTTETSTGAGGITGTTYTLTTVQDTVPGTTGNDVIKGIISSGLDETVTAGDSVNGGDGIDTIDLTVADATTSTAAFFVSNVEKINIVDLYGATFDATSVLNDPAINFTNTQTGLTSQVANGSLGSVVGLAGKGNLTVDYLTTSGTADTAKLALTGAGTSATARSTVDVSNANTVEAITIAGTGTNFVTLNGGTNAKTVTVTGAGINNFDISNTGALAGVVTLDASASTGTNTFVMGSSLNTTDVIKGGTGADTVETAFAVATLIKPTMTGVETLKADFDAAAIVDLANTTGLTTLTLAGSSAHQEIKNASSTLATVNVLSQADADNTLDVAYKTGVTGDLALKIGTTATTAADIDLAAVTLENTSSLAVTTINSKVYDTDSIDLNGDQAAVSFTLADGSTLTTGATYVDNGSVDAFNITVGADATYSGGLYTYDGNNISAVNYTVNAGGYAQTWVETSGGGTIGDITINATGTDATAYMGFYNEHGDVGNITVDAVGTDAFAYIYGAASGGSIGNIDFNVDGDGAEGYMWVSAGDWEGAGSGGSTAGNIGNINVTVNGDESYFSGNATTSGGDIGNVTFTMTGDNASGYMAINSNFEQRDNVDGDPEYQFGGNIGDITVSVDGDSNQFFNASASGGNIGDISLSADNSAELEFWISANAFVSAGTADNGGNVGNVSIFVGEDSAVSGAIEASGGDVGNVSITVDGASASGGVSIYASQSSGAPTGDYLRGGNIGDVTIDINGNDSSYWASLSASGGDVGAINVTINGNDTSGGLDLEVNNTNSGSTGGDIGAINVTGGDDTSYKLYMNFDGSTGPINFTGGDMNSAGIYVSGGWTNAGDDNALLGDVNFTVANGTELDFRVSGFSGSTGDVTIETGANGNADIRFDSITGDIGNLIVTGGANAEFDIDATDTFSMGFISVNGGDAAANTDIYVNNMNDIAGVDASAWLGTLTVNLAGVTVGTTITVGQGGSTVTGAEGGDNIFLSTAAKVDIINFDGTPTAQDAIFGFAKANDIMDFGALGMTAEAAVADNAAAFAIADTTIYVFADGSNTTTLETIVDFTNTTDVAAFLAAAFTGEAVGQEITCVINDGSTTAYAYYVDTDLGAGAITAAAVQLIGVVTDNGALTIANTQI